MIENILVALWLFIPAGFANIAASQGKKMKFLNFMAKPVDCGLTFRGKRLLGQNKTIRGFFLGTVFGILCALFQKEVYDIIGLGSIADVDYDDFNVIILGALLGFGALLGDSVESFFKRQINIAPGEPWFPFDQTDFIFGAFLIMSLYYRFVVEGYIAVLVVYFLGHLVGKVIGYYLGMDDKKI